MDSEKDFPSKLYYILMKKQPLITYNLVGKITYGNNNTYTMMAESHGMCAVGEGSSIKKAKNNASIAFLKQLGYDDDEDPITSDTSNISPNDELSTGNNAVAVSKLYNILIKKYPIITYSLVNTTCHGHMQIYTIMAKTQEMFAMGEGSSKIKAKNNAAIAYLKKLGYDYTNNLTTFDISNISPSLLSKPTALEINSELDHIGLLKELCEDRGWEYPNYECEHSEQLDPLYTVVCSLREYKSLGEQKTKEAAQMQAARLVYDEIKDIPWKNITEDKDDISAIESKPN